MPLRSAQTLVSQRSLPASGRVFDFLCAVLRGQSLRWPGDGDARFADELLDIACRHGVELLVWQRLAQSGRQAGWPPALCDRLRKARCQAGALEILNRRALEAVLGLLNEHGVRALLMKGTPLAYSHYPAPELRPRGDTDLFIQKEALPAVKRLLEGLGYAFADDVRGEFISYQLSCCRPLTASVGHILDIHWRANNAELFARALPYEELLQQAVGIAPLGPHARALGPAHALLLACMHRVGHRASGDSERLIWLYDMDRLIARMDETDLQRFGELIASKGMVGVCRDGLRRAQRLLATPIPDELAAALDSDRGAETAERLLHSGRLKALWLNANALPGWREKAVFLRELVFPPGDYMLRKYPARSRHWLPLLYLRRAVAGIRKRLFE